MVLKSWLTPCQLKLDLATFPKDFAKEKLIPLAALYSNTLQKIQEYEASLKEYSKTPTETFLTQAAHPVTDELYKHLTKENNTLLNYMLERFSNLIDEYHQIDRQAVKDQPDANTIPIFLQAVLKYFLPKESVEFEGFTKQLEDITNFVEISNWIKKYETTYQLKTIAKSQTVTEFLSFIKKIKETIHLKDIYYKLHWSIENLKQAEPDKQEALTLVLNSSARLYLRASLPSNSNGYKKHSDAISKIQDLPALINWIDQYQNAQASILQFWRKTTDTEISQFLSSLTLIKSKTEELITLAQKNSNKI
jgi:hypothetical protein